MPREGSSGANAGPFSDTDDFGRVRSMAFKRGKTDSGLERSRQRTLSNPNLVHASLNGQNAVHGTNGARPETPKDLPMLPDGIFLSTNLTTTADVPEEIHEFLQGGDTKQEYGYLASERHVVLGLDEVVRLVDVVAEELGQRGLTTPLLFSPHAIDIRPNVVKKLIAAFIATCPHHLAYSSTETRWREEAAFAGPQELAMLLRWGLARIVRLERGVEVRGFLDWESYVLWRQEEQANGYHPTHCARFIHSLENPVRTLFNSLFHLFTRFASNATSSGLTPIQLSTYFGPLIFGLGNLSFPFSHVYNAYLKASHATEHLLLSFIRWQESQTQLKGAMPVRLKDWIRGYPSMISDLHHTEVPRRGAKLVRLASIRRNVRLYSPDLVKHAASWSTTKGDLQSSKEWSRIAPSFLKLQPRYSDTYRKYLNIPSTFHPDLGPGFNTVSLSRTPDEERKETGILGLEVTQEDDRFQSLTDMRWGTFENFGFSDTDKGKLAFDLTESARKSRAEKRETLSWNDFSSAGFTRTDEPLSVTLQFSTPVASTINSWASQSAEIHRKLKKAQKALPPFGWDTTPVLGREEMVEEGFIEVFASLVYGSGWMDRAEVTFRECNWALVEFKAMPTQRPAVPPSGDPRTSSILFLFEEFVPLEYRNQLAAPKKKGIFAPANLVASLNPKSKQWKPAQTLNGKPYVVGNTPTIPKNVASREADFEHMLKSSNATTKVSLTRGVSTREHPVPTPLTTHAPLPDTDIPPVPPLPAHSPVKTKNRFKIKSRKSGIQPAEYDEMDFETREASDSDSLGESPLSKPNGNARRSKRLSNDDGWIDILVADPGKRRIAGQDAEPSSGRRRGMGANRSDPELARVEMEQVLAGVPPPEVEDTLVTPTQAHNFGNQTYVDDNLPDPEPYPYTNNLTGRRSMESDDYTAEGPIVRVQSPSTIASRHEQRWPSHQRESVDSRDFEPMPQTLSQEVEIPSFIASERNYSHELIPPQPTSATLPPSPSRDQNKLPEQPGPSATSTPGKVANVSTLIDMFQQKAAPLPSKLPVRTASLENPKTSAPSATSSATPSATSSASPPGPPSAPSPEPTSVPPRTGSSSPVPDVTPAPLDLPAGRISPGRYIHGAPLHNVMEEEEED
ncbi:hypothetical protein FS842_000515 [Serendipita sp. 407]|nr:hypothetical protein FRC20_005214 [Serendipita sp. 405]KAG9056018.1 hypothetical protein FS842_000515 [Serendipita sp. 407]